MPPKKGRFSRATFPRSRPTKRVSFPWGTVSLYSGNGKKAAVVVSKKVFGKAHDRNRTRRRMYSALSEVFSKEACLVVVFPRREALSVPFTTLVDNLREALSQC